MDLMNRRTLMGGKQALVGQFALWKVVNVTSYKYYSTCNEFKADILKPLIDAYQNISIRCEFINNTSNNRAAIDFVLSSFVFGAITTNVEGGHRVGGHFGGSYGADIHEGCQIYIYYAVLERESTEGA